MKKKLCVLGLTAIMLITGCFAITGLADSKEKEVDVMFLHDTHSHLNEFATVEDEKTQVLGGFAKIKTLINEQKEDNPDTLLLDAGDFSMGTLIQVMYEEEASEIRMLGELGMEVTTLGNHEFDYKAKGLANMLNRAVESGDKLPQLVVCNVDWDAMEETDFTKDQALLEEAFENYDVEEYVVVEKNGIKIAITGVFGKDALDCVPNCPLVFEDPIEAVKDTVEEIKEEEKVDMIVCVSHSGTWEDPKKSEDELLARRVIKEMEGEMGLKHLDEYADTRSERGQCMLKRICEQMGFDSLGFQPLDGILEAIGVDRNKVCTYCWDGRE